MLATSVHLFLASEEVLGVVFRCAYVSFSGVNTCLVSSNLVPGYDCLSRRDQNVTIVSSASTLPGRKYLVAVSEFNSLPLLPFNSAFEGLSFPSEA